MSQPINNVPPAPDEQAQRMLTRLNELDDQHFSETSHVQTVITAAREQQKGDSEKMTFNTDTNAPEADTEASPQARLTPGQVRFYASDQCNTASSALQEMVDSPDYETDSEYYKDSLDFRTRHLDRLSKDPNAKIEGYISNLKLMTRRRRG